MARKKKNIVLEKVWIEKYAAEGKSIARVDGKAIFVENVVPGDLVDIRLTKDKKVWAEGHPIHFHQLSEKRVTPFCKHFGVCGGCQWQMLPYALQLEYKQQQVVDNLERIAKVQMPTIMPIVGADATRFYRNKIEYTFATEEFVPKDEFVELKAAGFTQEKKAGVVGFHAKGFWDKIVDIETCHLQKEPTNEIRLAIKEYALANHLSFYNLRKQEGFLRTMQIRLCETGEWMANIVFGENNPDAIFHLLDFVLQKFPQITSLLYTINTKRNDSIFDLEPQVYFGKGFVEEHLEDFKFKIGPKSFFQTNTIQGTKLYQITRDFAELTGKEIVYDLYCGTGSIGIFCSQAAKKIIGVEVIEAAIDDAKINASFNHVTDAQFYAGDVIDICTPEFFEQHGRPDVIITDPPRAGMHEKLVNKLKEMAAPIIVYVSCNPATQARDLALLDEKYEVTKIQSVDMFPHTLHIENVVQLKLRK